ncbi:MAG: hypothetical protein OJI67_04515 [Prosthecobacter sp.]|nr:hypothetical protein [Prosthecobacter sp.]
MKRILTLLWLSSLSLFAQDVISDADQPAEIAEESSEVSATSVLDEAVIPKAYDESRYQSSWSSNPFLRVTKVIEGPKVDWSNDWALAGMYKSTTGKITISLQNKQTGEYKRVSSDEKADSEFHLVQANFNRNRNEASVEIEKDNKKATIKYDDNLTSRPITVNNTFKTPPSAQTGAPGSPNVRPGQPVNATPPNVRGPVPGSMPSSVQPGPAGANGQQVPVTPPTISRRRQLIPAPVMPAPSTQK